MHMGTDGYSVAFNALKKIGKHNEPFQVLTHVEFDIVRGGSCEATLHFQDLLTGTKKVETLRMRLGQRTTIWNPFTRRGPYILNPIENAIKKFRTVDVDADE